ncbi:hypothetical protein V2J09_010198 [Rumex salicifolius]
MDSSSTPPELVQSRNWLELPRDVTMTILMKLRAVEILESAQFVCKLWYCLCKDPSMWRIIDAVNFGERELMPSYEYMILDAINRSSGGLLEINIETFGSDELISNIAERAKFLKCLRLRRCSSIGDQHMIETIKKMPQLEEVELTLCSFTEDVIKAIGNSCPQLKSFKLNDIAEKNQLFSRDGYSLAIAETMPNLSYLQLIGSSMTNEGLQAILDGCPNLVSLDLRACFLINLSGHLGKRCAELVKNLRMPDELTTDYEFVTDYDSDYMDYLQIIGDMDFMNDDELYSLSGDSELLEADYEDLFDDDM